MERRKR